MAHIELPRALDDYFAFAETTPTRNGRRFAITLPYFTGGKLDRLQWWFHVSPEQERQMGDAAVATLRAQATARFRRHIERWLENTRQRLHGDEPIPHIGALEDPAPAVPAQESKVAARPDAAAPAPSAEPDAPAPAQWRAEKVANG